MPTRSFWIVASLLLVWALFGDAAYLSQVTADPTELAKTDPTTAKAFATMPEWAWSAYAIAVWVGTLAAIALLVRRRDCSAALCGLAGGRAGPVWLDLLRQHCDRRQGRSRGDFPAVDHRHRRVQPVVRVAQGARTYPALTRVALDFPARPAQRKPLRHVGVVIGQRAGKDVTAGTVRDHVQRLGLRRVQHRFDRGLAGIGDRPLG